MLLAIPAVGVVVAGQLALTSAASAAHTSASMVHTGAIKPNKVNNLDCNSWSPTYHPAATGLMKLCTDPHGFYDGHTTRFFDNGHYVGHDEPSVKFISSIKGSGNQMTYVMRLPKDPKKAPTASGSVTDYGELSVAPWFGLPICDGNSYPQNPCTPNSDTNSGGFTNPKSAGSAFMELQFYPPGFTPFVDAGSCSATQYCSALNIDSLECTFQFKTCNNNCIEPVNFSFLQTDGVPPASPAPQNPGLDTFLGNAKTLKMNPGDTLVVQISSPPAGLTTTITDVTTHQTGTMTASAKNGFANTSISNCAGTPHTFRAEYSTAKKANQVPWAALEGGVLMEQEIGHGESCNTLANKEGFSQTFSDGTFSDANIFQTCNGGPESPSAKGEGPCSATTGNCQHAMTQGRNGPIACPKSNAGSGVKCEYSDGFCAPKGTRNVMINGTAATESFRTTFCYQNQFQNGDLDFDGMSYLKDWPNGSANFPQTFRYLGPLTVGQKPYAQVQYETDAPASERLCNIATGKNCTAPPLGAKFYPFWSINNKQLLPGITTKPGFCIWNFGQNIKGLTINNFGGDKQYGKPDVAQFGGTTISPVFPNPTLAKPCQV